MRPEISKDPSVSSAVGFQSSNPLLGIALKLASTLIFAVMIAGVKMASDRFPVGEVVFARAFFGIPPLLLWLHWRGGMRSQIRTKNIGGHLLRSTIGVSGMFLWFSALARLPLPDAQAISFAGPFFGVVLAVLILGEKVWVYRWTAVLVGFVGVLIVLSDHIAGFDALASDKGAVGALLALGQACVGSLAMIQTRRLTATEGTGAIVFYFSLFSSMFALFTLPLGWIMPTPWEAVVLVTMGLFGGVGQVLLTNSYRYTEASTLAPFDYVSMIWMVLIGYFIFAEVPSSTVIAGSVIIVGSGVFVLFRERRLSINRAKERKVGAPM
jgi:drug/metabolite transporter (DMT)-like permease